MQCNINFNVTKTVGFAWCNFQCNEIVLTNELVKPRTDDANIGPVHAISGLYE